MPKLRSPGQADRCLQISVLLGIFVPSSCHFPSWLATPRNPSGQLHPGRPSAPALPGAWPENSQCKLDLDFKVILPLHLKPFPWSSTFCFSSCVDFILCEISAVIALIIKQLSFIYCLLVSGTFWLGWSKGSVEFFHNILQKNPNKLFGQPST